MSRPNIESHSIPTLNLWLTPRRARGGSSSRPGKCLPSGSRSPGPLTDRLRRAPTEIGRNGRPDARRDRSSRRPRGLEDGATIVPRITSRRPLANTHPRRRWRASVADARPSAVLDGSRAAGREPPSRGPQEVETFVSAAIFGDRRHPERRELSCREGGRGGGRLPPQHGAGLARIGFPRPNSSTFVWGAGAEFKSGLESRFSVST